MDLLVSHARENSVSGKRGHPQTVTNAVTNCGKYSYLISFR